MVSIDSSQVTPEILSLFDITKPTMLRAFNVLEGVNRGQILVESLVRPAWAVVREVVYGTLYFGGQVDAALVAGLVQHFRMIGEVGISCWLEDTLNEMLPANPDYDGRTLYFTERSRVAGDPLCPIPAGYGLARRDRNLLKQSFDYESTLDAFATEENILMQTLGVIILYEGKVVCEAATGAPTHERIEVGVTTDKSHRQRGLATIACTHLIGMCEAQGYRTWWDCARQNIPSIKLARKLGYQNEREYRFTWWNKLI